MSDESNSEHRPTAAAGADEWTDGEPFVMPAKGKRPKTFGDRIVGMDRSLPFSAEAESGVLSGILNDPSRLNKVFDKLPSEAFHHEGHLLIFELLKDLYTQNKPIDIATVTHSLRERQVIDKVGGAGEISRLYSFIPVSAHFDFYLLIVQNKWFQRRLIEALAANMERAFAMGTAGNDETIQEVIAATEGDIMALSQASRELTEEYGGLDWKPQHEVLNRVIDQVEAVKLHKCEIMPGRHATGFTELDRMTAGLCGGQLICIAGRPKMGKTSLAMNIVTAMATAQYHYTDGKEKRQKKHIAVVSLEMSAEENLEREVVGGAGFNLKDMRFATLDGADEARFDDAIAQRVKLLGPAKIDWLDVPGLTVESLIGRARRLHKRHPLDLIVVDYLQLLKSSDRKARENRQLEIAHMSRLLKQLAKELNIPIIVLAQLNRAAEERANGRPEASDLRESGAIEQDIDILWLVWRHSYYQRRNLKEGEDDSQIDDTQATIIFALHRGGPVGDVPVLWWGDKCQFVSTSTKMFGPQPQKNHAPANAPKSKAQAHFEKRKSKDKPQTGFQPMPSEWSNHKDE